MYNTIPFKKIGGKKDFAFVLALNIHKATSKDTKKQKNSGFPRVGGEGRKQENR